MTNFPPETYLAAARIAYPDAKLSLEPNPFDDGYFVLIKVRTTRGWEENGYFNPGRSNDYRALREALDKEYGVIIYWLSNTKKWESHFIHNGARNMTQDDDITTLMLRNVQALIEAGVVE